MQQRNGRSIKRNALRTLLLHFLQLDFARHNNRAPLNGGGTVVQDRCEIGHAFGEPLCGSKHLGIDQNKKGFVGLYLVPIQSADEPSFELTRIGRGYSLLLKGVFLKLGLDFKNTYYRFVLKPVDLDGVGEGFFAKLTEQSVRKDSEEDGE